MAVTDGILVIGAVITSGVAASILVPSAARLVLDMRRSAILRARAGATSRFGSGRDGGIPSGRGGMPVESISTLVMRRTEILLRWVEGRKIPVISSLCARVSPGRAASMDAIREQLPDALRALSASLSSGQSFLQAFSYVASNTDEPLSHELSLVVWDMQAGKGFRESFDGLKQRVPLSEVELLATVFSLQQRTGGSLEEMLETALQSIRDSLDLQRNLRVQTAQGRLSAKIVTIMPFLLLVFLALVSPGYVLSFFSSPVGLLAFAIAVILDVAGLIAIKRILSLEG